MSYNTHRYAININKPLYAIVRRYLVLITMGACVTAMMLTSANAQTIIYQNDFENPTPSNCPNWGGTASAGTLAANYNDPPDAIFAQTGSADRLCVSHPSYADPSNTAGNFAITFGVASNNIESWGLAFDPQGEAFINGSIQLSKIRVFANNSYNFTAPETTPVTANFYRLPAGQTYTLSNAGVPVGGNVRVIVGGVDQTPIDSDTINVTNSINHTTFDWQTYNFSVDTSAFATGDKLIMVFTGLPLQRFMAFDNLIVTANNTPPTVTQVSQAFATAVVAPGASTQLTIDITGNNIGDALGLVLNNTLPTPLRLDGIASNTCGGTPTITPPNALALMAGTVPAAGCQIVLDVTWDEVDQCSVPSVTNLITDTGDATGDFSFTSGQNTAMIDATADLACLVGAGATPHPVPSASSWSLFLLFITLVGSYRSLYLRRRSKA
ncbi:hypothetical protein [Ostreibacterium oceani]|uniref:IPTL-CTERM sorting domain-containing protein n=1 Tax=Ostreibacterium oceani TaxID=2654998 RepID=A0A6N7EUS7_9GAMM|nr:hypothetical protein [Ostreibacterium oceani]MPV85270.1 hypothetical protein [Ostreibacterium oceani]